MKVMKFGGSSLRTGKDLERIAKLILQLDDEPVIVVSALQGVTDHILKALPAIKESESNVQALVDHLRERHMTTVHELDPALGEPARAVLDPAFEKLERLLYGIAYTEELTPKTQDLAVSFGERLSARLMALAIQREGTPSEHWDADELGILTDGNFGMATARLEESAKNVRAHLEPQVKEGIIPVVTGFFGRDDDGHVTTFGRGGSDYSAAVLARALGAEALEVWKDVDGFLTADPEKIDKARPLPYMTYDEAAELAY
ncbi:MAG: aspartate kinase, partial [Candidatus Thermoplasmatota archaeon]|nr:aspartate kinase [Candidatus Thermoplasmatota archaeon]